MKDIDWSEAPEGTTHLVGLEGHNVLSPWEKHVDGERYVWKEYLGRWDRASMSGLVNYNLIVKRPTQWKGPQDGLPPVGTECEIEYNVNKWVPVRISAYTDQSVVIKRPDVDREELISRNAKLIFRPIQSERDKLIQKAKEVYSDGDIRLTDGLGRLADVGMLVDPGRKPMSRLEAQEILTGLMGRSNWPEVNKYLDALGYKE